MDLETSLFWVVTTVGFLVSAFYLYHNRIEDPKTMKIPSSWRHFEYFRLACMQEIANSATWMLIIQILVSILVFLFLDYVTSKIWRKIRKHK